MNKKCPICGNNKYFYKDSFENEIICKKCGWKINKKNVSDNEAELYKKEYFELIKSDSSYVWMPYICPICGFEINGEHDICEQCGWEKDDIQDEKDHDFEGGANDLSFNQYKKMYEDKIKNNPKYVWKLEKSKN